MKKKSSSSSVNQPRSVSKARIFLGLLFILVGGVMALSFLSYLLTWKTDQSQAGHLMEREIISSNMFGKLGGWIGQLLIFDGIGIAAFIVAFLFVFFGLLIIKVKVARPWRTFGHSLFFICWLPIAMGAITMGHGTLSGVYGFEIVDFLRSLVGILGLWTIIIVSIAFYFILEFNVRPSAIKAKYQDLKKLQQEKISAVFKKSEAHFKADEHLIQEHHISNEQEAQQDSHLSSERKQIPEDLADDSGEITVTLLHEDIAFSSTDLAKDTAPDTHHTTNIDTENPTSASVKISIENDKNKPSEAALNEVPKEDFSFQISVPKNEQQTTEGEKSAKLVKEYGLYDHTLELSKFVSPSIDLLKDYGGEEISVNREELEENKNRIVGLLKNFKIGIAEIRATIGPTVTLYEIIPEAGIRVASIKKLQDDIALNLSALGIRIIAPMPGKGTIGIEVPRKKPSMVSMRSVIASQKFQNTDMELPIVFGKTISNEIFMADLTKMPHLLMAGATGQGKSVGINAILTSLLYKKHPSELKFVMVDPKKVELSLYSKIERHYLAKLPDMEDAILTDNSKVIHTLNSLCAEMDLRYELLKEAFCRNIKEYNQKFKERKLNPENGHRYLPYIVLVVDEFADLIMTAGKEVEHPIARLAQLARAIGIHLIVATQRPSVNVITGMIKANFPARISFRVNASIDSRTILDSTGAEQLVGKGDMLFSNGNHLTRIQCAFVDTPEVEKIVDFIGEQSGYASALLLPEVVTDAVGSNDLPDADERDPLFEEAARIVVGQQQGSTSNLQRQLKLGFNRAGRIMDQLEANGIVGGFNGAKPREVLLRDINQLEEFLASLK